MAFGSAGSGIDLPVNVVRKKILDLFDRFDTLIIQGETGSGKTTRKRLIFLYWSIINLF